MQIAKDVEQNWPSSAGYETNTSLIGYETNTSLILLQLSPDNLFSIFAK